MEYRQVLWVLFLCMFVLCDLSMADTSNAPTVSNTQDGIWALSSRFVGIFLTSFNGAEITSQAWSPSLGFQSDVAYDTATKSLTYCKSVGLPFDCELHQTSLDQCYDVAVTTIPMDQESQGLEVNSESRLAYLSLFETPGIIEVNLETGQRRMLFSNEDVYYMRISPDKNFLYFTCLSNDQPIENHIRKGNIDGTGIPQTILTRTQQIFGFGIDFPSNKMYYTQDNTIFSSDLNGNDERELVTDTGRIYEMSVVDNYLYWGGNSIFKRLNLAGDPSTNSIETVLTASGNELINHLFISPSILEMSLSTLTLSSSEYTANESDQSLTIAVTRTGNLFRCSCAGTYHYTMGISIDGVLLELIPLSNDGYKPVINLLVFTGNRRFTRQAIRNTLNFASGDTTKSHTLTWVDNAEADGPDEVTVLLRSFSGANAGAHDAAMVVIRDDDCRYFFETTAVTVDEDVGYFDVTVKRMCTGTTPPAAATIRIEPEESNGGAQKGLDFTSGVDVNFPLGENTVIARLYIINDIQPESLETFILRIPLPDNGVLAEPYVITISVDDFDTLYVINQDRSEVLESGGTINVVIQRLGNTTMPGSVALTVFGRGSAEYHQDFMTNPSQEVIEFAKDVAEVMVPITIINDALVESNETFEVLLQSPLNGNLDDRRRTMITIIDDEVEVMFADSHISCMESRPCSATVMRRGYLSGTTTSRIRTEDLSAVDKIDFIAVDTVVTFNPWVTTQEVQITLIDDDNQEPQSSFVITITEVSGGRVGEPSRGYVALWDDDNLPVMIYSLEQSTYTLLESEGPLEIIILRGGSFLGQAGSVRIVTQSSTTNNDDFENVNMVVNFEENQSKQSIFISITNDEVIEETESFLIQLTDVEDGMLGEPATATASILDDDATYFFDRSTYPVAENEGERVISVRRDGYIQTTGYVTLQITGGGSATFKEDYNFSPIGHILEFEPGQTKLATVITIIDDQIEEETETFDITLSRPQNGTLGDPSSSKVLIEDDDRSSVATTESTPSRSRIDTFVIIFIAIASTIAAVIIITLCVLGAVVFCRRRASPRLYPSPPAVRPQGKFPFEYDISPRNQYIGYY